jgi:hypothetical protein
MEDTMAAKKTARSVKTMSLAAATNASVKAALRKASITLPKGGGTTVGFVLESATLEARNVNPLDLAKEIASGVSAATGVRVKPTFAQVNGGIIMGFVPPQAFLKQ